MPNQKHYVIIGNGPAGNTAAITLRENDPDARITIISHENMPFYSKPRLLRYLAGEVKLADLTVKPTEEYLKNHIRLRLGQQVVGIDPAGQCLVFQHKETLHYTGLIIATGSRARLLPSMTPYAGCLQFVTAFHDIRGLKEKIASGTDFFIFGGDLVGFKFVKLLTAMGKQVTLLLYPKAFWPFHLTDEMRDTIVDSLASTCADILTADDLETIVPDQGRYHVTTRNGVEKQVDLVFSFNGLIPEVDFARGSGLEIDHGILVDETMHTSLNHIYACGSCAQIYNPEINTYTTAIGWPNAVAQGKVAALNLQGECRKVRPAGRKYFDLEGVKIKTTWWEDFEKDPDS